MDTPILERLTAALYRVTDRMADTEPLKWALRKTSLELAQTALKNPELLSIPEEEARSKTMALLFADIIRLLELASSISYISRVNFEVLIREYRHVESGIFRTSDATLVEPRKEEIQVSSLSVKVSSQKTELSLRKKKILEHLVSTENGVSVGDLVSLFGGKIGDKTIQRDLSELVLSGSIRRMGERRWRRYFLQGV